MKTDHVVMFSGGLSSWLTARRVRDMHGTDNLRLVFADTKMEDPDLYRFIHEAAADVGVELEIIEDGRNPWEVFHDVRFLGNTRIDPCSRVLKRQLLRKWLETEYPDPQSVVIHIGFSWDEEERLTRAKPYWKPYTVEAPLCRPPLQAMGPEALQKVLDEAGIEMPRLYRLGFKHNNCGGFCVKAGHANFRLLLQTMPDRYRWHEEQEQNIREHLDKDIAILRDRRGGKTRPLTLREFRERIEAKTIKVNPHDWGACSCMAETQQTLPLREKE